MISSPNAPTMGAAGTPLPAAPTPSCTWGIGACAMPAAQNHKGYCAAHYDGWLTMTYEHTFEHVDHIGRGTRS